MRQTQINSAYVIVRYCKDWRALTTDNVMAELEEEYME